MNPQIQNFQSIRENEIENIINEKRILIVDDVHYNIEALEIILEVVTKIDSKNICDKAFNGAQALEIIKNDIRLTHKGLNSSYDLILMDCNMPIMDGYEAT